MRTRGPDGPGSNPSSTLTSRASQRAPTCASVFSCVKREKARALLTVHCAGKSVDTCGRRWARCHRCYYYYYCYLKPFRWQPRGHRQCCHFLFGVHPGPTGRGQEPEAAVKPRAAPASGTTGLAARRTMAAALVTLRLQLPEDSAARRSARPMKTLVLRGFHQRQPFGFGPKGPSIRRASGHWGRSCHRPRRGSVGLMAVGGCGGDCRLPRMPGLWATGRLRARGGGVVRGKGGRTSREGTRVVGGIVLAA